ncbi:MAG: biotin--[acetyl-CoA-carboxylase] ligase, partial [Clostridia bacterium]
MTQKEKILKILEGNRDCVVSGQQLADQLGISRAAVWKAIKSLQGAGYVISAKTNGGYALQAVNDIVSRSAVEVCLGYSLKDAYFFDEVDSTNNFALTLAQNGVAEGALVVATQQSNGKGRVGKSFVSPKGGIYMSVVLRPNCPLAEATLLTPMAAVAVAKAIRKLCNVDAKIKWVNDIYLDGKKICGILTQAVTDFENEHVAAVVVGIGINFDTPASAFDGELACKARSIFCAEQAKTQQINAEQPTVTK